PRLRRPGRRTEVRTPASPPPPAERDCPVHGTHAWRALQLLHLSIASSQPLDLESTFSCGQIFRWRREGEWWCGARGGTALALRAADTGLEVRQAGMPLAAGEIPRFLGLD